MARSIFWRLANAGNNTPGPINRAVGTSTLVSATGIAPSTAIQIDLGDGVWLDRTTAGGQWWNAHPGLHADIDLANDRARIAGVTYGTIAAAKAASAIKANASGVEYIDVSGLGTSIALAATGVTPPTAGAYAMIAMDDGDDGVPADEYIQLGVTTGPKAAFFSVRGGVTLFGSSSTPATPVSTPIRMAMRAKAGPQTGSYRASINGEPSLWGQNAETQLPDVNRLCLGNRSANDRGWVAAGGVLHRVLLIKADLTDSELNALLGS